MAANAMTGETTIQGCDASMFANSGSLRTDDCATRLRDVTNRSFSDWTVYNPRPINCDESKRNIAKFAACQKTLRYKDGVGNIDACQVAGDSTLRLSRYQGVDRKRHQLFPREFVDGPNMQRGDILPEIDSVMTRGGIQQRDKRPENGQSDCDHISETDRVYNFIPMIQCLRDNIQDVRNIVADGPKGGLPSRMFVRSPEFLKSNGFDLQECGGNTATWIAMR